MNENRWIILVRKATQSRYKFLAPHGRLTMLRAHAVRYKEQKADKMVAHLEKTHASYFFEARPWGIV